MHEPDDIEPFNEYNPDDLVEVDPVAGDLPDVTDMPDTIGAPQVTAADLPIGKHLYEYLCGTAGTGKTYLSKQLKEAMPDGSVELAATTGIAAVNLGEGTTIHALLKFFDTQSLRDAFRSGLIQAQLRRLRRAGLRRIILDEVSMLSGEQLMLITRALAEVNDAALAGQVDPEDLEMAEDDQGRAVTQTKADAVRKEPIGLTLVGDFGQLPPVPDKDDKTGKSLPVTMAFESPEWVRFQPHIVKLTKIHRQTDLDFVNALHAIRRGDVVTALRFFTPDKFHEATDENFEGTTVFAKNIEVDRHNQMKLDLLTGASMDYVTKRVGKQRADWKQVPDVLGLKQGALVMLLANRREYQDEDDERGKIVYANGDLGTLVGLSSQADAWRVKLQRTGGTVAVYPIVRENTIPLEPGRKKAIKAEIDQVVFAEVKPLVVTRLTFEALDAEAPVVVSDDEVRQSWEYLQRFDSILRSRITEDGKKEIIGTVMYMPMRAAYGCTVHKTQGLTLDKVQINIRDYFFKNPGMLFVALSRARTAEGLRIVGSQAGFVERCKVNPKVTPWL